MRVIEILNNEFSSQISIQEKRPGIQQIFAPLFHEDGDMMSIFLDLPKDTNLEENQMIRISDYGMTLMRLSYEYDIDTPNKERIFQKILLENGLQETDGNLWIETKPESLYPTLMQFSHTIAKICNMRQFKREVLNSLFEEMIDAFVFEHLIRFSPRSKVSPIPERDDLEVDYEFRPNGIPLYLFTVKDNLKARLATISFLEFQKANLPFLGVAIHDDFERLSRSDRRRLTSACDKQFPTRQDFEETAVQYFERRSMIIDK